MVEGEFPKSDGDILYASEVNDFKLLTGDGSNGAFSESSGTTDLTQGTIYQYTSFLLDTNATLSASSTSKKPIIIKVQGNVTINGTVDLVGKGCAGGGGSLNGVGYGTNIASGGRGNGTSASSERGKRCEYVNFQDNQRTIVLNGTGGGGTTGGGTGDAAGGASSQADGIGGGTTSGTKGDGGGGGCTIFIICGGTLTFGASSSIDVSGTSTGTAGGGGGSGDIIIIHKGAKTDNGLSTTKDGGTSSAAGNGAAGNEVIKLWSEIFWN